MERLGSEARGRRVGGWIGGIVVGVPAARLTFAFTVLALGYHEYAQMLVLIGLGFVGPVGLGIIAGQAIGGAIGRPPRRYSFFDTTGGFQLGEMSNERLRALWRAIATGHRPSGVASYRVAALRKAIRQTAVERGLILEPTDYHDPAI
jgi:hypothetical protein